MRIIIVLILLFWAPDAFAVYYAPAVSAEQAFDGMDKEIKLPGARPKVNKSALKKKARHFFTLGGGYDSYVSLRTQADTVSKRHDLNLDYVFNRKNYQFDLDFLRKISRSSYLSNGNVYQGSRINLYDTSVKNKWFFGDNYFMLHNRLRYDEASSYFYDSINLFNYGRFFFDKKFSLGAGIGYRNIKEGAEEVIGKTLYQVKFNLTKNLLFSQEGSLLLGANTSLVGLDSNLSFKIKDNLFFNLRSRSEEFADDLNKKTVYEDTFTLSLTFIIK